MKNLLNFSSNTNNYNYVMCPHLRVAVQCLNNSKRTIVEIKSVKVVSGKTKKKVNSLLNVVNMTQQRVNTSNFYIESAK